MNLIKLCLSRPVGVSVGVLLILLFGVLSIVEIPIQLTPNVDVTVVNVQTRWRGANPQEIEREIVDRQEEMLRSVKGLRKMTSSSRDDEAEISLEFYNGIDKSEALRDTADKLRQVSNYPLDVDEPTIVAADQNVDQPIAWLILRSTSGDSARTSELRDFAEDFIKPYFDRVEGVAEVDVYGGRRREVAVTIRPGDLAARGLSLRDVQAALLRQNTNTSAGTRTQGKRDYAVRTLGQYENTDEILNTVVAYTAGGPVYVRDVAHAELTYAEPTGFVRNKGQFVLAMPIRREVGSNVIEVMRDLRAAIAAVNAEVLEARHMDLEIEQVYDETVYIDQSIWMVMQNLIYGGGLAVVVLMLFLRSWRPTLIVALSIPVSVIGTFVVMAALGRTLNVISLAGLAFAVGMVVDNAIVVLENCFRHYQMGKSAWQAALDGTQEVWGAVVASTLTTMVVFIPVIFVQEEAGQLFRDISVATVAAVGLSLVVSVTVIPVLASRLLGGRRDSAAVSNVVQNEANTGWFANLMGGIASRLNRAPLTRLGVILVMTVGSLALIPELVPAATYLPSGNRNLVFGFLVTPPGYSLEEFERMGHVVESYIAPYWAVEEGSPEHKALDERWVNQINAMIAAGQIPELAGPEPKWWDVAGRLERRRKLAEWLTPPPLIENFFFVDHAGGCFMGTSSRDPSRVKPLVRLLTTAGGQIPGVFPVFFQTELFSFGGGNNAEVQIRGDDLDLVTQAGIAMQGALGQRYGSFPRATPSNFALGRPEVQIVPDRERAADLGLNAADIGFNVEACVDGAYIGDYRGVGGDTIDIRLYYEGQRNRATARIGDVPIFTQAGIVPLASACKLVDTTAQEQIQHVERQRAVTLEVRPPETIALETVINAIKNEIEPELRKQGQIAPSVLISLTGNADKLVKARNTMVGEWRGFSLATLLNIIASRFFLSVLVVYLLMAALYESWVYPLVIMFSVPLALFGGFLGLFLCHWGTMLTTAQPIQQLDVLTFLGFVILVGVVVNNAILLVSQALINMHDYGMESVTAISESVRTRVRPVFMTSLTTFFGQLPLALFAGAGSELYRGLAAVMLGGLLIATIGTLVLVPAVLGVVTDIRARLVQKPAGTTATAAPAVQREA